MKIKWWEFSLILAIVLVLVVVLLPLLSRPRESARRASCQNNLKQLGLVLKMYANESEGGVYPPLSETYGDWMMDMKAVYPEYLSDLGVLVCPSSPLQGGVDFRLQSTTHHPGGRAGELHPDCVSGKFYTYTGFVLTGDETALALYTAYHAAPERVRNSQDVAVPLPRWEKSTWTPQGGGIAVMWDRIPPEEDLMPHNPSVINVLSMDGSVQAVKYSPLNRSENFPVTELTTWTFGLDKPRLDSDCY